MESQDGITVRPMRLKVLYTFDNENKTICLARWPHVLDIQTAYLDERTQIGVIELKTSIQAIVSASPELVAQLGKDYTVYAYDYSEYETPLVGQGMLSWVLASASPTPNAPAHQSQTMVTGRVCKNPLGLFSKGAQETLEVKLRLVPVPTVMQSEYLDSMQKYRELSNVIPHDFDAQTWTNFVRQHPALLESTRNQQQHQQSRVSSPMDQSGIERVHQLLSEGATPREFSGYPTNESIRSVSPSQSYCAPSRMSTPGGTRPGTQQQQQPPLLQQPQPRQSFSHSDIIRPSSSASMQGSEIQSQIHNPRRGSFQSGYGSGGEESTDHQPRKRAKLYQSSWPGKSDMNIERQPSSLRVAASTAASVRIHRPTPVNPAIAAEQSNEEPVRPPTPISRPGDMQRRARLPSSLLRQSSVQSSASYTSPYSNSDDLLHTDQTAHSPDDSRYQGLFEPPFTMPSSPPVMECRFPARSSPNLPPISLDTDSGFMSGGFEDLMDDGTATTPIDGPQRAESEVEPRSKHSRPVRSAVQASSPASMNGLMSEGPNDSMLVSDAPTEQPPPGGFQRLPPATSRPSSRASTRPTPKPLVPAPISQSEAAHYMSTVPASDPVVPTPAWSGPVGDMFTARTPTQVSDTRRPRSGGAAKRSQQVQAKLDQAILSGTIPPYCENCGAIETPTWRRAWANMITGGEEDAKAMLKDQSMLFWETLEQNDKNEVTKFKMFKKGLSVTDDKEWTQVLLCNPCGLWLHKFKSMRPENRWNKQSQVDSASGKKKRLPRNRKQSGGPLSNPSTRTRSKAPKLNAVSSPAPTEASSVHAEEGATPRVDNDQNQDEAEEYPSKRRRANSVEPPKSTDNAKERWQEQDAVEALRRAIQSSPARNMNTRNITAADETNLTPKPVRRALFQSSQADGPLKELDASFVNSCSPRRSPRIASKGDKPVRGQENKAHDDLDGLFESPSIDFDLPVSPTPRRRNPRINALLHERRHSLPCNSPTRSGRKEAGPCATPTRLTAERLQRIQAGQDHSSRSVSRQSRSPSKHGLPSLPDPGLHSESFSIDGMILDIFDDAPDQSNSFPLDQSKFANNSWANWLPSDYISPSASDEENGSPDDLINAILSDPAMMKENILDSNFNPFDFEDSGVPDSGFFSSDALHIDPMDLAQKAQPATAQAGSQPAVSPNI
ncbi:hypothetical protein N7462_004530 [Penicillium macrosclerotiorum]|uniref:uncharacterized protein n=1 Tax=Penicillium macrosclerotiorum TaxID=303699 RepID=UPI002547BE5A|nr:uncharacterized protein N7462_004530 [Penicillium macrosclerotiorum]KAJ5690138.1 hypothetical protein N7462_004530 [Penicillium macrosclerotiorum]